MSNQGRAVGQRRDGVPEWAGQPEVGVPARTIAAALLLCGVPAVVAGLAWGPFAGVLVALLAAAALAAWITVQGRRALRALGAAPLGDGAPRLANLVLGLAADLGMPPPTMWVLAEGGPNALVCRAGGPCLVVTETLLEGYTRTEHEAVAAHCLVRLRRSSLRREALATALGRLGPAPVVTSADDARAAALTRYPPALASAVAKAAPARRFAPFWLVAEPPWHEPAAARIAQLHDL